MPAEFRLVGMSDLEEEVVRECFQAVRHLVPSWCRRITFERMPEDHIELRAMDVMTMPDYRQALIRIYPVWFEEEAAMQRHGAIHEIMHLQIDPVAKLLSNMANRLLDRDDETTRLLRQLIDKDLEQTVEELTYLCKHLMVEKAEELRKDMRLVV
jgi:hypothetical protein